MTREEEAAVHVGYGVGKGEDQSHVAVAAPDGVLAEAQVVQSSSVVGLALRVEQAEQKPAGAGEEKREAISSSGRGAGALVVATPLEPASNPPLPLDSPSVPAPAAEPKASAEKARLEAKPEHREAEDDSARRLPQLADPVALALSAPAALPPPPQSPPAAPAAAPPTLHVLFSSPLAGYSRDGKCHPLEVLDYSAERETLIQVRAALCAVLIHIHYAYCLYLLSP